MTQSGDETFCILRKFKNVEEAVDEIIDIWLKPGLVKIDSIELSQNINQTEAWYW